MSKKFQNTPLGHGGCIVHCPATIANLVCGFDILGLALNTPYDIMEVKLLDEPIVIIHHRDNFKYPGKITRIANVHCITQCWNGRLGFDPGSYRD